MKNMLKKFLIGTLAVVAFVVTANLALASYDFGSAILKVGSRGQYVTTLQNLVGATPVDGIFGPKTKAKVVAWQNAHGLIVDGLFGPISKAKANETGTNFGAGCTNASGFSTTTGIACSSLSAHTFPAGCTNASGFSTTTGFLCLTGLPVTTTPIIRGGGSSGSHHHTALTGITITGTLTVGQILTAVVAPSGATVDYQWQIGDIAGGESYPNIEGATSSTYTILAGDVGKYIDVTATGTGNYSGSEKSDATTVITPANIAAAGVTGFVAPVVSATPEVFGALTAGAATYTVTNLTWSPVANPYLGSQAYTATVTLTSAAGYKFPVAGIAVPTANGGGTVSAGTTAGGDITGNTLSYTVLFPATAPVIATASTIVEGAVNPTVIVTGTNFKSAISTNDLSVGDLTVGGSLAFSGVTYTSGTQITVSFAGTAGSSGNVTIQARTSAFDPAGSSASNELTVGVTAAPATGDMAFVLTTPVPGVNSLTGGGATRNVNISVVNDTSSVVITGTKTAGQTVVIKGFNGDINGLDSLNVTTTGTDTAPIYTVNMITPGDDVHNGGTKWFEIVVSEEGKSDITYNVYILVASPVLNPVTSANYTTAGAATTTITITLTAGTFKAGQLTANDFNFGGTGANAIADALEIAAHGVFGETTTGNTIVAITIPSNTLAGSSTNTITVLGATQATQAASVAVTAS